MTDLQGKFTGVGDQLATQHAEILEALTGIAAALGGAPTDTFADLLAAINETNTLLATINSTNSTKLTQIFDLIDTMNNNASLNAQRILAAMLQMYCPCDTDVPLLPPPLLTDPISGTDAEKCQRIQYFLDLYRSWVINIGQYLEIHDSISGFAVANLLELALSDVGITTGELSNMSTGTRDSLSSLLNTINTPIIINAGLFNDMTTSDVLTAMRGALYAVNNASDGKAAADAAIAGSGASQKALLTALFYSSWANTMYSADPVVDASAYDGSVCAPDLGGIEGCTTFGSQPYTYSGHVYHVVISSPIYSGNEIFTGGDFSGWSVELLSLSGTTDVRCDYYTVGGYNGGSLLGTVGSTFTYPAGVIAIGIHSNLGDIGGPFSIELCPPA